MAINPLPNTWRATLEPLMANPLVAGGDASLLVLIDGAQSPQALSFLSRRSLDYCPLFSLLGVTDQQALALSPILVPYSPPIRELWLRLIELGDGYASTTLIITPESMDLLALRLAPWCRVEAAGQPLLLRFADTRVLVPLHAHLDDEQRSVLLGPTAYFAPIGRDGTWLPLPLAPSETSPAANVVLDEKLCAKLVAAAEADEVFAQVRAVAPHRLSDRLPADNYRIIRSALSNADKDCLEQPTARLERCLVALNQSEAANFA